MWFIGVEVEQETSAPLLKKILDPPLSENIKQKKQGWFYSRECIYIFTNISEDTTFLLQGVTYWVMGLYYDVNKEQRAIWHYI